MGGAAGDGVPEDLRAAKRCRLFGKRRAAQYGAGAEEVAAAVHKDPASKQRWVTEILGPGDIDRMIIEWRSILRQTAHAPELDWARWRQLQQAARDILNETQSPTLTAIAAAGISPDPASGPPADSAEALRPFVSQAEAFRGSKGLRTPRERERKEAWRGRRF